MANEKKKVSGEGSIAAGNCPWCNHEDADFRNEYHPSGKSKQDSKVLEVHGVGHQCQTCGKVWPKSALGQKWSIELERGELWVKENRARELRGA